MKFMKLSSTQEITVFGIIVAAFIAIWTTTYIYSPDLVNREFNPPDTISSNQDNILHFELNNYGEKKGSYILKLTSDEILFSQTRSYDKNVFENNIHLGYVLPPKERNEYSFYMVTNESGLKPNATISFIYIDSSPLIFEKKKTWNFYYELDTSSKYILKDVKYEYEKILIT